MLCPASPFPGGARRWKFVSPEKLHGEILALLDSVCTVQPRPDLSLLALKLVGAISVVRNADERAIWQPKGTAASLAALDRLINALDAVEKAFGNVPAEGHEAIIRALGGVVSKETISLRDASPGQAAIEWAMDIDPAKEAANKIADIAQVVRKGRAELADAKSVPAPVGRPKKDAVFFLTKAAANLFEWLTQTSATRSYNAYTGESSPFEKFLDAIFEYGGSPRVRAIRSEN
jgi:hypothetical protein